MLGLYCFRSCIIFIFYLFSTFSRIAYLFPHNHVCRHFLIYFPLPSNLFLSMLKTSSCFILFFRKKVGRCRVKSLQGSRWSTIASVGRERCHLISCYYTVWSLWTSRMGFYEQASWSGKNFFFLVEKSHSILLLLSLFSFFFGLKS